MSRASFERAVRRDAIRATILANKEAGRPDYEGLSSSDIGEYNRALMFGAEDEAFPDEPTWSRIVD